MMSRFSAFQLSSALWTMLGPISVVPCTAQQLPSASGPAFRERMMSWSTPAPSPAPAVQAHVPEHLPRLSSMFGYRSDPLHGARAMHSGVDIPGPPGAPVQASASGIVRFAGRAGGYGNMIEVDHGGGLRTRYAHLSQILVRPHASVERGQTIALMGSTGRSTGSHLHFEVRANGLAVDPLGYLDERPSPSAMPQVSLEPHLSAFARARAAMGRSTGSGL